MSVDLLVYSVEHHERFVPSINSVNHQIEKEGVILYQRHANRSSNEVLLRKSAHDRACMNYPLPSDNFGFHAQQAVEKLLKALISAKGEAYAFIYDLEKLQNQLIASGEVFPAFSCDFVEIQPFAVLLRYDDGEDLSEADRQRFMDTVDALREFVLARIAALR